MTLNFAKNLQLALAAKEMTQQELADKLKTTQATINRWIKGINEPNLTTLIEICKLLDETPNSILGFDEIVYDTKTSNNTYNNYGVHKGDVKF